MANSLLSEYYTSLSFVQVAGEADQSKDRKEGDGADSDNDLELESEGGGGGGGGFGGIRMSSVQEVIAKARFDEAFNIAPTVGLSNDLEELARLVDEEQQEEEEKSMFMRMQNPVIPIRVLCRAVNPHCDQFDIYFGQVLSRRIQRKGN